MNHNYQDNKGQDLGKKEVSMSTIKDIAAALGISHSTVSRALNDSKAVSEDTKLKVREMAQKLNYTPNESARSLKLANSHDIGVFFSSLNVGTSPSMIHEVTTKINGVLGGEYNIVIKGIDTYMKQYNSINRQNFKGIIVVSQKADDNEFIERVLRNKIPMVVTNRKLDTLEVNNLYPDDLDGAKQAMSHLFDTGHMNINIIEGVGDFNSNDQRMKGVLSIVKSKGMNIVSIESGDYSYKSGYEAMQRIIKAGTRGTALFAFNDDMAIGAMRACFDSGVSLPEAYSIIGFDNDQITQYIKPALTTINRPIGELCNKAAVLLKDEIKRKRKTPKQVVLPTKLVVRESVKKIK